MAEVDELLRLKKRLFEYEKAIGDFAIVSKADKKGYITDANDKFIEISGYKFEELVGKSHAILKSPNMPDSIFEEMWKSISSKKIWHGILENRHKDGSSFFVDATVCPVLDEAGEIIEYLAIYYDVTRFYEQQKLFQEEKSLNETLLSMQESIVAFMTEDNVLLKVNKRFFDYFDFKDFKDFRKKHKGISELFLKEHGFISPDIDEWKDLVLSAKHTHYKVKMIDKFGAHKIFSMAGQKFDRDYASFYILTLSDITELEAAIAHAKLAEKTKGEFLANMSHEIRTPMNAILGFTNLLFSMKLDKQQNEYLDIINKSAENLLMIINDILDFSKIESGKFEISLFEFDTFKEFEHAIEVFSAKAGEKDIDLMLFVDPELPRSFFSDALRIKQVLSNFLSNAIKFTPQCGKILVEIKKIKEDETDCIVCFSVRDSGVGIPQEKLETIFSPFAQVDASTSRQYGGTGLGLSICKSLVKLLGGIIKVESEVEKGSRFFFELAMQKCQNQEKTKLLPAPASAIVLCDKSANEEELLLKLYLEALGSKVRFVYAADLREDCRKEVAIAVYGLGKQAALNDFFKNAKTYKVALFGGHSQKSYMELVDDAKVFFKPINYRKCAVALGVEEVPIEQESMSGAVKHFEASALVAEDSPVNQKLITILLSQIGIKVTIAKDGNEAVELYKAEKYDIVLMDIHMPNKNGSEALQEILELEKQENLAHTPIVSLTANALKGDKERFLAEGFDDYLSKPIEKPQLDRVLFKYLSKKLKTEEPHTEESSAALDENIKEAISELGLDEETVKLLVVEFTEVAKAEDMPQLKLSIEEGDPEKIKQAAHKLKGASLNLRLGSVAEILKKIEEAAKKEDILLCKRLYEMAEKKIDTLSFQMMEKSD